MVGLFVKLVIPDDRRASLTSFAVPDNDFEKSLNCSGMACNFKL